jgi:hypothetical protein
VSEAKGRGVGNGYGNFGRRMGLRHGCVSVTAAFVGLAALIGVSDLGAARGAGAESESKIRIAFVGDSISDGYWEGITVAVGRDACLKDQLEIGRFAKNSTGFSRPDRFDWVNELRRVAESFKPKLFVMSLGLNDAQSVVEHGQITHGQFAGL